MNFDSINIYKTMEKKQIYRSEDFNTAEDFKNLLKDYPEITTRYQFKDRFCNV